MSIQTVLFDLDGTLIDTNELINVSFEYTFKQYDFDFTKEEILAFNGPPLRETFQRLNPKFADEMIRTYREHNHNIHEEYVKLFPNVLKTLDELKSNDIPIGIVTSKMRDGVQLGLDITGLSTYFETVITVDDVTQPKPHPESVIKAMNDLRGEVDSTIMIGDNYHDIQAGHNAGMVTAGVSWTSKGKEYLEKYKPTYMLEDMQDLLRIVGV